MSWLSVCMCIFLGLIGNWSKIGVSKICRLTQRNIGASRLDLEFCWRSRELEVSLEVGRPLFLVTVRKVPSSMDFMSTLRSTTRTLLGLSMQPSTKPWSILLVQHLLNWLLMLLSAPWRPWKFGSKLSLGLPEVYQMGFPSSSSLKELLGMELCKTFWLCYVVTMELLAFGILILLLFDFAACTKGLFLFGDVRFHVSWNISIVSCYLTFLVYSIHQLRNATKFCFYWSLNFDDLCNCSFCSVIGWNIL